VFLVGQPTLERKLAQPELAALSQRVAVRTSVERLGLEQTGHYINFRLAVGGSSHHKLFTTEAAQRVHEQPRGISRLINIVCERALLVAYADGEHSIGSATVEAAVADLGFSGGVSEPSARGDKHDTHSGRTEVRERLDRLEEKLGLLIMTMARAGFIRAELVDSTRMKRWLKSLLPPPVEELDPGVAERPTHASGALDVLSVQGAAKASAERQAAPTQVDRLCSREESSATRSREADPPKFESS
jgi:hypothetical protein